MEVSRDRSGPWALWVYAAIAIFTTGLAFLTVRSDQHPITNLLFLSIPAAFGALTVLEYRAKLKQRPSSAWVTMLVFGSLLAIIIVERFVAS
jgi:FtsH-binding integral membrane protein